MNLSDEEVNRMEEVLKGALRRQPAPDGLADRVLARVAQKNPAQGPDPDDSWLRSFPQPLVRWAALAAVAAAMIVGVHQYNLKRERAQGEAAKQRLMLALRVAGSKLQLARSKVNEINRNQTTNRQVKE
jgi:negative regulator of sigma E activity